jgi:hypothetical protein
MVLKDSTLEIKFPTIDEVDVAATILDEAVMEELTKPVEVNGTDDVEPV